MGYIGNVYAHFPQARLERTDREGIVEVLRVLRVDGESSDGAEIFTLGIVFGCNDIRNLVGCSFHVFRIDIWQTELRQDGMHLGVVVSGLSQDVDNLTDRVLGIFRPFGDFHHGLVAILSALQHVAWNEDVIGQRTVFGEEESIELVHLQCAHKGVLGTFDDFYHFAFYLASLSLGGKGNLHLVAMHGMSGIPFGNEDGFATVFRQERVLSVALALELSGQDDAVVVQLEMSVLHHLNEVVFCHFIQDVQAEHLQRMGGKVQTAKYLFD